MRLVGNLLFGVGLVNQLSLVLGLKFSAGKSRPGPLVLGRLLCLSGPALSPTAFLPRTPCTRDVHTASGVLVLNLGLGLGFKSSAPERRPSRSARLDEPSAETW